MRAGACIGVPPITRTSNRTHRGWAGPARWTVPDNWLVGPPPRKKDSTPDLSTQGSWSQESWLRELAARDSSRKGWESDKFRASRSFFSFPPAAAGAAPLAALAVRPPWRRSMASAVEGEEMDEL